MKSLEKFFEVTTPKLNIADNLSASYSRDFEAHETLNGMKVNQSSIQGEREERQEGSWEPSYLFSPKRTSWHSCQMNSLGPIRVRKTGVA